MIRENKVEEKKTAARRESEIRAYGSKSPTESRLRASGSGDAVRRFTGKNLNPKEKITEENSKKNVSLTKLTVGKSKSPSRVVKKDDKSRPTEQRKQTQTLKPATKS